MLIVMTRAGSAVARATPPLQLTRTAALKMTARARIGGVDASEAQRKRREDGPGRPRRPRRPRSTSRDVGRSALPRELIAAHALLDQRIGSAVAPGRSWRGVYSLHRR